MSISEAYFDESYEDSGAQILCIAAYVFRKTKAKKFSKEWGDYLKKKGLPHFHMADCAHRTDVFKGRDDCDAIARALISQTKDKSAFGVAVSVNMEDYAELLAEREGMPSAYAFALFACMNHIRLWREKNDGGNMMFFFEQGHSHQNDAHNFLTFMFQSPRITAEYGYSGHAFVPKQTACVQPADFLAWHWRLESKRSRDPNRTRPMRADFRALGRPGDKLLTYSRARLEQLEGLLSQAEEERHRILAEARASGRIPLEWSASKGVTKWLVPDGGIIEEA